MILRTEEFQKDCNILSLALENNSLLQDAGILELEVEGTNLIMKMNNVEHYEELSIPLASHEEFNASIEGSLFLNLINKVTSETVELKVDSTSLIILGNGTYNLPLIFNDKNMFKVKKLEADIINTTFTLSTEILSSINYYNNKELVRGTANTPVQNLHYFDEHGVLTFNNGACVNSFEVTESFKVLLSSRFVSLLKMFELTGDSSVTVQLGYRVVNNTNRRIIILSTPTLKLTSLLLSEEELLNSVPADLIRGRASKVYDYKVTLDKNLVLEALNRLALFIPKDDFYINAQFNRDEVVFGDDKNFESIFYSTDSSNLSSYSMVIDLKVFLDIIKIIPSKFINLNFGDHEAFTITHEGVTHIIPETDVS